MRHRTTGSLSIVRDACLVTALIISSTILARPLPLAAQEITPRTFQLVPGVLIDLIKRVAYVMSPQDRIDTLDLLDGRRQWSSAFGAKPLALISNRLVAQQQPRSAPNVLELVILDTEKRGELLARASVTLPEDVEAFIDERMDRIFEATAEPLDDTVLITWQYRRAVVQGIAPDTAQPVPKPREARGSFRVDVRTGITSATISETQAIGPIASAQRAPTVATGQPRVTPPTFVAADANHILHSERIADDRVWKKYRWTIYERATGQKVGSIAAHLSWAPFFVVDRIIVYETQPYVATVDGIRGEEPRKLRAVSLQTGIETWNVRVRDTTYRGPYPP